MALIVILAVLMILMWSMNKQQHAIGALYQMTPTVIQEAKRTPHRMTEAEKRIVRLTEDAELLVRRLLLHKSISRAHCVSFLHFSEYRWNRSTALLRRLNIYDGKSITCSYASARQRLRSFLDTQIALARVGSYVPNV